MLALGTVAVSPKVSTTEGNQKLCAYLEAGLAVVAFDTPATGEILGDAGVRVPVGDGAALAEVVVQLLENEERRRGLEEAAVARARVVGSWDRVVDRLLDAYLEA